MLIICVILGLALSLQVANATQDDHADLMADLTAEMAVNDEDTHAHDDDPIAAPHTDVRHSQRSTSKQSSMSSINSLNMRGGAATKKPKNKRPAVSSSSASSAPPPAPQSPMEAELERAKLAAEAAKRARAQDASKLADEAEEERKAARRLKREKQFQQDLKQMDKETAAAAKRKRKSDKKVIDRVLRASTQGNLYAVLGVEKKWWRFWTLLIDTDHSVSSKQVKVAYRTMAKRIHPDKNKDARAEDAFDLLQEAHEILGNERSKLEYDRKVARMKRNGREDAISKTVDVVTNAWERSSDVLSAISRVLGPFAPSVFAATILLT